MHRVKFAVLNHFHHHSFDSCLTSVKGELFRPNEYNSEGDDMQLSFTHCLNTGLQFVNYFRTKTNEEVMLTSDNELSQLSSISIQKK